MKFKQCFTIVSKDLHSKVFSLKIERVYLSLQFKVIKLGKMNFQIVILTFL